MLTPQFLEGFRLKKQLDVISQVRLPERGSLREMRVMGEELRAWNSSCKGLVLRGFSRG